MNAARLTTFQKLLLMKRFGCFLRHIMRPLFFISVNECSLLTFQKPKNNGIGIHKPLLFMKGLGAFLRHKTFILFKRESNLALLRLPSDNFFFSAIVKIVSICYTKSLVIFSEKSPISKNSPSFQNCLNLLLLS